MKLKSLINKKGQSAGAIGIIFFFVILFLVLILGFIGSFVIGIVGYASDEIMPVIGDIGMAGPANVSEAAGYGFDVVEGFIGSLPWIMGFAYVAALAFCLIFAVSYTANPNPILMGLFVMMMLLVIFGAIIISNMYEEIYTGNDEIATKMHEQTIMAYMILHSPVIFAVMGFITGIYMFAGRQDVEGGI
jgi:hypothetical protein